MSDYRDIHHRERAAEQPDPVEAEADKAARMRTARRATATLSEARWEMADRFRRWYDEQLFPGTPLQACDRWMDEHFPGMAPVDRGLLRFACMRTEDGKWREFRRKEA